MRILWASNAPFCPSGYGVQTKLVTPRLQAMGHDLAIACNYGVEGNVLTWPGPVKEMALYPKGQAPHSVDVIGPHALHHNADLIMTHYDAWVYDPEAMGAHSFIGSKPWVAWFPVDTDEICDRVYKAVEHCTLPLVQTRHGQASMAKRGLRAAYVPAAYDPAEYYPMPAEELKWREKMGVKPSTFLAVMVAANKGADSAPSRKAFPQIIEGFAQFHEEHPDSFLYIHTQSQAHQDLEWYAEKFGISESVAFAHGYFLWTGLYPPDDMRQMLNSADVLLSPSMGEGVGVPIIEAQACGTPVITGDWTSMPEITKTGLAIPKESAERYTVNQYGDMYLVHARAVKDALLEAVKWQHDPEVVSAGVAEHQIDTVMRDYWAPAMDEVERRLRPQPNRAERRKMKFQKGQPVQA